MDSFALFPHGNIISEIFNLRKDLIQKFFEENFKIKITPLFCEFVFLEFSQNQFVKSTDDLSNFFCESKIKPTLSKIQFDGKYFFVNVYHPILSESKKTNLEFLPYSNRFNLAKIDLLNSDLENNFLTEKIKILISTLNWQEKSLRVFQIAKILSESIFQENNSLVIQTKKKKWIKIN